MAKSELLHVFHAVIGDTLTYETTMQPDALLFWDKYKKDCEVVEGSSVIAYGDFRCCTGDVDKRELIISVTKKYINEKVIL